MTSDKIVLIAMLAHSMNKAYCESIGDNSQPVWEDAPGWQKDSAINGVAKHLENPDMTPEDSHNSWMEQKTAEGWQYGPVKDVEKKEHPCYLPYSELPQEQRVKDYIFRQAVHSGNALYGAISKTAEPVVVGPVDNLNP